jgi:hypothetical protein
VLAGLIAIALLAERAAGRQVPSASSPNATAARGTSQAPRTPWGAPDLQGIWSSNTITPLERPEKYAGREFLTDEDIAAEVAAREQAAERRRRAPRGTVTDLDAPPEEAARVVGAYQAIWSPAGRNYVRTKRTSLIVDPPDGKIPPLTPEGQKRAEAGRWRTAYEHVKFMDLLRADGPEDRNDPERCRALQLPCIDLTRRTQGKRAEQSIASEAVRQPLQAAHVGPRPRTQAAPDSDAVCVRGLDPTRVGPQAGQRRTA